jgi:glutamate-1-semialdehyde 2,1-aminomutase
MLDKPIDAPPADLAAALQNARDDYTAANPKSRARHDEARRVMPGGNTRTVLHYSPFPVTIERGEGARLRDIDGHDYADFLGEYTAGLYGHSDPVIADAIRDALEGGLVLGGPNLVEAKFAALMCERFPAVERIRFCNSGTESNIFAIGAARAFTGRTDIIVVDGSYHGGPLSFESESPLTLPYPIHKIRYNDSDAAVDRIRQLGDRLAAVLIEPVVGAGGGIPADYEFLAALRSATADCGALLIFDEVMTSRLAPGGMHGYHGLAPDLVSFGKYLGGGLTFGAFGGRADILDRFDPARPDAWPHAGTFNNNVLTMAAGYAGLSRVFTPEAAEAFSARGDRFRETMIAAVGELGLPVRITGLGSMLSFHIIDEIPNAPMPKTRKPMDLLELLHLDMMARGQFYSRRGMINLSLPMTDADLDAFRANLVDVLRARAPLVEQAFARVNGG